MKPTESSKNSLKQNPFTTYRDPVTGLWVVEKKEKPKTELAIA